MALLGLIDTVLHSCHLKVLWRATKVLDTKIFPQHNIAGLIFGITFIVLFSQEKPLGWKEKHTHTHTQTNNIIYSTIALVIVWIAQIKLFTLLLIALSHNIAGEV